MIIKNYTLECKECGCKIKVILSLDSPFEKLECPKHGQVEVALISKMK